MTDQSLNTIGATPADTPALPEGFTLDVRPAAQSVDMSKLPPLPDGFKLDVADKFEASPIGPVKGEIEGGNIDLEKRPKVKMDDGSTATVRSMSFEEDGKEVLVPTVSDDGRVLSDAEAIDQYHKTGKHLGVFDNAKDANVFAEALHKAQDKFYSAPDLPALPDGFTIDGAVKNAETPEEPGYLDSAWNIAKGAANRFPQLAAGALRTGAELPNVRAHIDQWIYDLTGLGDPEKGKAIDEAARTQVKQTASKLEKVDFGYTPQTTWEDVKKSPAKNFIGFAIEQGLVSAPDMAAALATLPAYVAARAGELGQQRAKNNDIENMSAQDLLYSLPAATASALLDRIGAKGMFGLDEAAIQSIKQIPKEVAKAATKEGATEAAQQVVEDIGTDAGTKKGFDPARTAENAVASALGGVVVGGMVRGVEGATERATHKADVKTADLPPLPEGFTLDNTIQKTSELPAEGKQGDTVETVPPDQAPVARDGSEGKVSPPNSSLPSISPEERAVLRRTAIPDEDIDAMSRPEVEQKVSEARAANVRINGAMVRAAEQYRPAEAVQASETSQVIRDAATTPERPLADTSPIPAERPVELAPDIQDDLAKATEQGVAADRAAQVDRAVSPEVQQQLAQTLRDSVEQDRSQAAARALAPVENDLAAAVQQSVDEDMKGNGTRQSPVVVKQPAHIDVAAQQVNTDPSEAQKVAGNYQKGHIKVSGLDVTLENPKGSIRSGLSANGEPWQVEMPAHYGYLKRTTGADNDHVDAYIGDNPQSKRVYVIDQKDPNTRRFDEHKVMLGVNSVTEARDLYTRAFSDGRGAERIGGVTPMSTTEFKAWLANGDTTKPIAMGKPKVRTNDQGLPVDIKGAVKKPDSLIEFLSRKGGVREDHGELSVLGLRERKAGFVVGTGPLIRRNGMAPDKAREAAAEAGYLPMESSLADFYDALDQDARSGRQAFSSYDDDQAEAWREGQGGEARQAEHDAARTEAYDRLKAEGFPVDEGADFVDRVAAHTANGQSFEDAVEGAYQDIGARDPEVADIPFFGDDTNETDAGTASADRAPSRAEGERGNRSSSASATEADSQDRPVRGEDRTQASGDRGGQNSGSSNQQSATQRQEPQPQEPVTERGADNRQQLVIPGAERATDAVMAQRGSDAALKPKVAQKEPAGLFSDDAKQGDLLDAAKKPAEPDKVKVPAVVYHGTSNGGFDSFDTYAGKYGLFGSGGYFTEDPNIALEYTRKGKGAAPTVYSAKLDVKNPLDMEAPVDVAAWEKAFPDYFDASDLQGVKAPTNESAYRAVEDNLSQEMIPDYEGAETMQDGIMSMGHDAITHIGGGRHKASKGTKHRVWIVFDPEQVSNFKEEERHYSANPSGWDTVDGMDAKPLLSKADQAKLTEIVKRASGLDPDFIDSINIPAGGAKGWGNLNTSTAAGAYSPMRDIVTLALDSGSDKVAYHESFHRLQNLFLTDAEHKVLKADEPRLRQMIADDMTYGPDVAAKMSRKEVEAEAFGMWAAAKDRGEKTPPIRSVIRRAWENIRTMLRRVQSFLNGRGFQTSEDIFGKARKGDIAKRGKSAGKVAGRVAPDYQAAYHGTPHEFDKFSTDHIGSGEGAQAFGWGLYFAGKKSVAEFYRDTLSGKEILVQGTDGKLFNPMRHHDSTVRKAGYYLNEADGDFDKTEKLIERDIGRNALYPMDARDIEDELAKWKTHGVTIEKNGKLYTVDVPEDHELLNWDGTLQDQSADVRAKLESLEQDPPAGVSSKDWRKAFADAKNATAYGSTLYGKIAEILGKPYPSNSLVGKVDPSALMPDDRSASQEFQKVGIPGHRFLDQGSRSQKAVNDARASLSVWESALKKSPDDAYVKSEVEARRQELADLEKGLSYNYVIYDANRVGVLDQYSAIPDVRAPTAEPDRDATPNEALGKRITDYLSQASKALTAKTKGMGSKFDRATKDDGETLTQYSHRKIVDYLSPVKLMQEKVGGNLNDLSDAYLTARLAEGTIRHEIHQIDEKYVSPAVDALAQVGASLKDLHKFMYALHAPERNRVVGLRNEEGSQIHKAATDPSIVGASGMSTNEANAIIREMHADPQKFAGIRRAASHIRAMLDNGLQAQLKGGLINKATYDRLTKQWEHYVPLRAESDTDGVGSGMPSKSKGFDVRGDEFKGATGRYSPADNVIVYAVNNAEQSVIRVEKNKAATAALRFINQFDPAGENIAQVYWSEDPDKLGDITKAPPVYKRTLDKDGKVIMRQANSFHMRDDVLAAKVGGKVYYMKFADPKVGLALKKMTFSELGVALKLVKTISNWQSLINTRANPAFIPLNLIRDVQTGATLALSKDFKTGEIAKMVGNIPNAWGALWRHARGKEAHGAWDAKLQDFMASGGKISFDQYDSIEGTLKKLQSEMSVKTTSAPIYKPWQSKPARAFMKLIEDLNDTIENGMRLAVFSASRAKGETSKRAAFLARDLTVDFQKKGEITPAMNALYTFFNASVQGNYNFAKGLVKSRKMQVAMMGLMAAGFAQHVWNLAMAGDDDDGENAYRKMLRNQPWIFERNMVFFLPGRKDYITIPLGFGLNAFWHLGMQGGAVTTGDKSFLPAILDSTRVGFDAFNPLGSGGWVSMFLPSIIDPVWELGTNQDFTGKPIYPSENQFDPAPPPKSEQAFGSTGPAFKKIAQVANHAFGGDDKVPGAVDVYPDSLEYLWGWFTGGVGRFASQTVQTAQNAADLTFEPKKTPFVRSFYGSVDDASKKAEYYNEREKVQFAKGKLKEYQEAGDKQELDEFMSANKQAIKAVSVFDQVEKQRHKINKERRSIEKSNRPQSEIDNELDRLNDIELELMNQARTLYFKAGKNK